MFSPRPSYMVLMEKDLKTKRRNALFLLGGFAGFAFASQGIFRLADVFNSGFDFVELDTPEGFRSLMAGEQSLPIDPFIGLSNDAPEYPDFELYNFRSALFYNETSSEFVQVAYFSDLYCPYCRVLSNRLIDVSEDTDIEISWHETPIFGEPSVVAAKGHIAAQRQGGYIPFHKALSRTPVQVTYQFLENLAARQGLDVSEFERDFNSDQTLVELARAHALAEAFGLAGTPALVVGRTLVVGQVSETNLRQIIEIERKSRDA